MATKVVLKSYPEGNLRTSDFAVEQFPVPEVPDGSFLVRNTFGSVDPMLRIFIDKKPLGSSAMPSLPLGTVIPGAAVGEIIDSKVDSKRLGNGLRALQ